MNLAGVMIGPDQPCRFIAELSCNHNGELSRAFRLLDAAKAAGASAAKLQCYTPDELVALRGDGPAPSPWNDRTMRDLYSQAMTPRAWFAPLFSHAADIGLPLFSSVFGLESLALLESLGCPVYKVAKFECAAAPLHDAIYATGKRFLVSVPHGWPWRPDGYTLLCPGEYPCAPSDVHLPDSFPGEGYLGLSSHCLAPELPIAAVARGAKLLEYHFQLDAEPSELERDVSLTTAQFAEMVRAVRATEALLAA